MWPSKHAPTTPLRPRPPQQWRYTTSPLSILAYGVSHENLYLLKFPQRKENTYIQECDRFPLNAKGKKQHILNEMEEHGLPLKALESSKEFVHESLLILSIPGCGSSRQARPAKRQVWIVGWPSAVGTFSLRSRDTSEPHCPQVGKCRICGCTPFAYPFRCMSKKTPRLRFIPLRLPGPGRGRQGVSASMSK